MAKSFNMSSFKSQVRQAQRKVERKMQSEINKATRKFESDVNRELRKYNSNVRRNQQIVVRELNKLRSSSSVQTKYTISLKAMHQHYTAIDHSDDAPHTANSVDHKTLETATDRAIATIPIKAKTHQIFTPK